MLSVVGYHLLLLELGCLSLGQLARVHELVHGFFSGENKTVLLLVEHVLLWNVSMFELLCQIADHSILLLEVQFQ